MLPIPDNASRNEEILLMSLMYKNNLMNNFLWNQGKVESPLCHMCNQLEETPEHILLECSAIDPELQTRIIQNYCKENQLEDIYEIDPYIGILNSSRNEGFMKDCLEVIKTTKLRETIIL